MKVSFERSLVLLFVIMGLTVGPVAVVTAQLSEDLSLQVLPAVEVPVGQRSALFDADAEFGVGGSATLRVANTVSLQAGLEAGWYLGVFGADDGAVVGSNPFAGADVLSSALPTSIPAATTSPRCATRRRSPWTSSSTPGG